MSTLGLRRNEMDASLVALFTHADHNIAMAVNNKVLAFVNAIEAELSEARKQREVLRCSFEVIRDSAIAVRDSISSHPQTVIEAEGPDRIRAYACNAISIIDAKPQL